MQIDRLFYIIYTLLEKKMVTAGELAAHFEVSTRTIYRDIDTLSLAGIPVYTSKGKGGGIGILDGYVLNKSALSHEEQSQILVALQSLGAVSPSQSQEVLGKLSSFWGREEIDWIQVDFSRWSENSVEKNNFNLVKNAILNKRLLLMDYYSGNGTHMKRTVEPMKLVFKGQDWYLFSFCIVREDFWIFKITRMKNLEALNESFIRRETTRDIDSFFSYNAKQHIDVKLKFNKSEAHNVYDRFASDSIIEDRDDYVIVTERLPNEDWIVGYFLGYGSSAQVLEPEFLRKIIRKKAEDILNNYL